MRHLKEKQESQHEDHLTLLAPLEALKSAIREVLREELPRLLATAQPPGERLLDVHEAAQRLGLAKSTIYKRSERCELASVKVGTRVLFRPADLDAFTGARRRSPEQVKALADHAGAKEQDK